MASRKGFTNLEAGERILPLSERASRFLGNAVSMVTNGGLKQLDEDLKDEALVKGGSIGWSRSDYGGAPAISCSVHRVTNIEEDLLLSHPLVRVHFVDARSGQYIPKLQKSSFAVSHNEASTVLINSDPAKPPTRTRVEVPFVGPQLTSPQYIQKANAPLSWEESLVWNHEFTSLLNRHVVILFELLDFGGAITGENSNSDDGFYNIAWAYLRAVKGDGTPNIFPGKKLKLQLYRYQKYDDFVTKSVLRAMGIGGKHNEIPTPSVFINFLMKNPICYRGYLEVTVSPFEMPETTEVRLRSRVPYEREINTLDLLDAEKNAEDLKDGKEGEKNSETQMTDLQRRALIRARADHKPCLLPDALLHKIPSGPQGSTVIAFSPNGRFLAAGCADGITFPVRVINVENGSVVQMMEGHHGLIHSVSWSPDSSLIITASADGTVKIWSLAGSSGKELGGLEATLEHKPKTYVYCAIFHPTEPLIYTGAFDRKIRVWRYDVSAQSASLLGSIEGDRPAHQSHVNVLLFDNKGERLFSADGAGGLCQWRCSTNPSDVRSYSFIRNIQEDDLSGKFISSLALHPITQNQILVTADHHTQVLIDLRSFKTLQTYIGIQVVDNIIKSKFSPDGKYVISGSESGNVCLWNTKTGVKVKDTLWAIRYPNPLLGVDWSSNEHLVALCAFGEDCPILFYAAEHTSAVDLINSESADQYPRGKERGEGDDGGSSVMGSTFGSGGYGRDKTRSDDAESVGSNVSGTPSRRTRTPGSRRPERERSLGPLSEDGEGKMRDEDGPTRSSSSRRARERSSRGRAEESESDTSLSPPSRRNRSSRRKDDDSD
jgi:WD40 repeat protein